MNKLIYASLCALGLTLSWLAATAHAEPGAAVQKDVAAPMMFGLQAQLVMPQADADNVVSTSLGLRATFAYRAHPNISVIGSLSYVFANERERVGDGDVTFYTIEVGARFQGGASGKIVPFGEFTLGRHTVQVDVLDDMSQSDLGVRFGGGLEYWLAPQLRLVSQINYSSASIEGVDVAALSFDVGIGYLF